MCNNPKLTSTSSSDIIEWQNIYKHRQTVTIFLICLLPFTDRISRDVSTMFDDVMDDFCEFSHIKLRFESWKSEQRDSYEEAYIGLCLPKLFTPLVRLQLVNWNPLEVRDHTFWKGYYY